MNGFCTHLISLERHQISLLVRDRVNLGGKAVSNMVCLRISIVWWKSCADCRGPWLRTHCPVCSHKNPSAWFPIQRHVAHILTTPVALDLTKRDTSLDITSLPFDRRLISSWLLRFTIPGDNVVRSQVVWGAQPVALWWFLARWQAAGAYSHLAT